MELDELKKLASDPNLTSVSEREHIDDTLTAYKRKFSRHIWFETAVATFAFVVVIIGMVSGHAWYPLVIQELAPQFVNATLTIHPLMYFSMFLMAIYCISVGIKLHNARREESALLSWSLKQRVESEIRHFEKQKHLWSFAHLWSFLPASVIGVSFFWGLQVSLIDQWWPTLYLLSYFVFIGVSNLGGIWLAKKAINNEIKPILEELYQFKQELRD